MGMLKKLDLSWDIGLVIIRLGIGASMFLFHGYDKLTGGPALWTKLGSTMKLISIDFLPQVWGFMAAFSESVCSILILIGVLFRPAAFLLAFTMFIAVIRHLSLPAGASGAGWAGASHALELLCIYAGLFFTGPGRYVLTIKR